MTKERKLAIEMWEGIRDMLSVFDRLSYGHIAEYKYEFCKRHNLRWSNHCWFCAYIFNCSECPLKDCGIGSLYKTVLSEYEGKDTRIEACNNIIKALGGKAND